MPPIFSKLKSHDSALSEPRPPPAATSYARKLQVWNFENFRKIESLTLKIFGTRKCFSRLYVALETRPQGRRVTPPAPGAFFYAKFLCVARRFSSGGVRGAGQTLVHRFPFSLKVAESERKYTFNLEAHFFEGEL